MKAVFDTNVVMSAVFFGGVPGKALSAWLEGKFELCCSPLILEEYIRVEAELAESRPDINGAEILDLIASRAHHFSDLAFSKQICRDPDDDKFIACAITASAQYLVTGDKDLLSLEKPFGIEIIKPSEFVRKIPVNGK